MSSSSIERRVARRFAVAYTGELACGTTVANVQVSDMSVTGCGVDIEDFASDAHDSVGHAGILNLRAEDPAIRPVMLPVIITNCRSENGALRFGLQFRRLSMAQMRNLIGILEQVVADPI